MVTKGHIANIINNYKKMEEELVCQLHYSTDHGVTVGSHREWVWQSLFERIVPKKFNIERSVFIMDSYGNVSKEVDLAIYDEQYTPYIFTYGNIKFIPVEAVAAVIECKSTRAEDNNLNKWLESVEKLRTGKESIVRINGSINYGIKIEKDTCNLTQTSTTPIKILCHMGLKNAMDKDFDIVIEAEKGQEGAKAKLNIRYNNKLKTLLDWYIYMNHYADNITDESKEIQEKHAKVERSNQEKLDEYELSEYQIGDDVLISFIFQFNQLLMLINNPLFFPHLDYVRLFKESDSI